jgi:hypothetical protein
MGWRQNAQRILQKIASSMLKLNERRNPPKTSPSYSFDKVYSISFYVFCIFLSGKWKLKRKILFEKWYKRPFRCLYTSLMLLLTLLEKFDIFFLEDSCEFRAQTDESRAPIWSYRMNNSDFHFAHVWIKIFIIRGFLFQHKYHQFIIPNCSLPFPDPLHRTILFKHYPLVFVKVSTLFLQNFPMIFSLLSSWSTS